MADILDKSRSLCENFSPLPSQFWASRRFVPVRRWRSCSQPRPQTTLAKQAGQELVNNYGIKKLPVSDPYKAPVGSVLVYDAKRAAGHVEIRTENGFVSDFRSKTPSRRPLLGIFAKI